MRNRAYRRAKAISKMMRRLKEDRNQHYNDLDCLCWTSPRHMARFKEQPQVCSCDGCGNQRHTSWGGYEYTMQEKRFYAEPISVDEKVEV